MGTDSQFITDGGKYSEDGWEGYKMFTFSFFFSKANLHFKSVCVVMHLYDVLLQKWCSENKKNYCY